MKRLKDISKGIFFTFSFICSFSFLFYFGIYDESRAEGLAPYRENYIQTSAYSGKEEVKFQISLGWEELFNLYGVKGAFSYTQISYWDLYNEADSRPFRESNYNPKVYLHYTSGPVKISGGYWHESNGGKDNYDKYGVKYLNSRSWDRGFIETDYTEGSFLGRIVLWKVFLTENEPIIGESGHGSLYMRYQFKGWSISQEIGKKWAEVNIKIPSFLFENISSTYTYRTGKMDSLIDYDQDITRHSIGLSFGGE